MKKRIITVSILMALLVTGSAGNTTFADTGTIERSNVVQMQTESLSTYMGTIYSVTQHPELDNAVLNAFKLYETNQGMTSMLYVYSGTRDECAKFRDYFNLNYGFTNDIRLTLVKSDTYHVVFENTVNADTKIHAFITEVKKAQEIARSLNAGSTDATINNIISWVKTNAKYYYGNENDTTESYISHYYGIYSNNEVLCEGYAMAVYQLCAMNGIKASLVDLVSPNNVPHAVNQVTYSDSVRWVDTTKINPISDELWAGYTYLDQK